MRPRYAAALVRIPDDIAFIQAQINEADTERPHSRTWRRATVAAGDRAYEMQARVTDSPPLWLALQRQVLVRGWSFKDLELLRDKQLDNLDEQVIPALADTLTKLMGRRRQVKEDSTRTAATALVQDAWHNWSEAKAMAIRAMEASGVVLPPGSDGIRIVESMVVDHTQDRMERLRDELAKYMERARNGEANEAELRRILGLCTAAIAAVGSVTATVAKIPEVWNELERFAEHLVRLLADIHAAPSNHAALLGMVIALRQTDLALAGFLDHAPRWPDGPGEIPPVGDRGAPFGPGQQPRATTDPGRVAHSAASPAQDSAARTTWSANITNEQAEQTRADGVPGRDRAKNASSSPGKAQIPSERSRERKPAPARRIRSAGRDRATGAQKGHRPPSDQERGRPKRPAPGDRF